MMACASSSSDISGPHAERSVTEEQRDDQSQWLIPLAASGAEHDRAIRDLHALLLRASYFEVRRRAAAMGCAADPALDDIALQSADDALVLVLAKLDTFAQRSRFTTWAYKFAINVAGVAVRRHAWRDRNMRAPAEALDRLASLVTSPETLAEQRDTLQRIFQAVSKLSPHQRDVLVSLAVDGVPIDVLSERLSTNRNALYKTLHDARQRLRSMLDVNEVTT